MIRRAMAATLVVSALTLLTTPAHAAPAKDLSALDLRSIPGEISCTSPTNTITLSVSSDTSRRFASAGYDLRADSHSYLSIGTGVISVVAAEHTDESGEVTASARRHVPRWWPRYQCHANTLAGTSHTAEIVYLVPPRRPSLAEVEAWCVDASIGTEWCPVEWAG